MKRACARKVRSRNGSDRVIDKQTAAYTRRPIADAYSTGVRDSSSSAAALTSCSRRQQHAPGAQHMHHDTHAISAPATAMHALSTPNARCDAVTVPLVYGAPLRLIV